MAGRNNGIDLLNDMPPGSYVAKMICRMAGINLGEFGDSIAIEEFRMTAGGFYVRTEEDEDIYLRCERVGKLISIAEYKTRREFVCDECGSIMDMKDKSLEYEENVCVVCAAEMDAEEG